MGSDLGGRLIQSLKWCMYDAGMKSRMDGMLAWCCFYKSGGRIIPFPFFLSFFLPFTFPLLQVWYLLPAFQSPFSIFE